MNFAIYQSYVRKPSRFFAPSIPQRKLFTSNTLISSKNTQRQSDSDKSYKFLFPSTPIGRFQDPLSEKPKVDIKPKTPSVLLKKVEIVFENRISVKSVGRKIETPLEEIIVSKRPSSSKGIPVRRKSFQRKTFYPRNTL
ncbi:hypothetical protein SteCoe_37555 [Stentor coeruleus]|uniref:Uncharacterized protein n=1 Tax=Stentor coeruleus TaxID=5963 RepID=A0A1R2AMW7_9CILI|nr:hypothetical protein SteCoe_37555 [Stentor coeruleus]